MHSTLKRAFVIALSIACILACILASGYVASHHPGVHPMRLTSVHNLFASLNTGDLIFTKASNRTSIVQQYMFGSFINHCAMIVRMDDGALWVWDVNPYVGAYMTTLLDFVHHNWLGREPPPAEPPIGLRVPYVFPPQTRATPSGAAHKSQLYIRRLRTPLAQASVLRFLQRNIGRPYSYRFWISAFQKATRSLLPPLPLPHELNRDGVGMFCSELIAHTYAAAGALDVARTPPESLLPHDFWTSAVALRNNALLQPERLYGDIDELVSQTNAHLVPRVRPSAWLAYHKDDPFRLWVRGALPDDTVRLAQKIGDHIAQEY